jgi:hypothetical protein
MSWGILCMLAVQCALLQRPCGIVFWSAN